MQISGKVPPVKTQAGVNAVDAAQKAVKKNRVPVAKGDRVELSEKARELIDAKIKVKQMPDVDEDKVARVKAQLEQGTYRVDSQKTAARMIEEALINNRE